MVTIAMATTSVATAILQNCKIAGQRYHRHFLTFFLVTAATFYFLCFAIWPSFSVIFEYFWQFIFPRRNSVESVLWCFHIKVFWFPLLFTYRIGMIMFWFTSQYIIIQKRTCVEICTDMWLKFLLFEKLMKPFSGIYWIFEICTELYLRTM